MNSSYYKPSLRRVLQLLRSAPFALVPLRSAMLPDGGIRYGTSTPPPIVEPSESTVPFVRATDIKDGEILTEGLLHTHRAQKRKMAKCLLTPGELILVRSGVNTGDCAIVPHALGGSYAAYDLILRLHEKVVPEYVSAFLSSGLGRPQLDVLKGRSAQPHLNAEEVSSVVILVPPLEIQRALVSTIEAARESRKRKLRQADALLSGIDAFLLEQLDLHVPERQPKLAFAARLGDSRRRCDPDFHSPRFREIRRRIERGKHPATPVGSLCECILTGFAAGREVQAFNEQEGIPHIRPLNISQYGELSFEGTKYVPKESVAATDLIGEGEALLNNTNSTEWVGKSSVFEGGRECCCSNHITRLITRPKLVNPWFLAALFNALRSTGYLGLLATNFVNQAGINTETLSALRVPVPIDLGIQDEIAAELLRRRAEARRLRAEAAKEWEDAKTNFERQVLGKKV